jgi:hypothetical protein
MHESHYFLQCISKKSINEQSICYTYLSSTFENMHWYFKCKSLNTRPMEFHIHHCNLFFIRRCIHHNPIYSLHSFIPFFHPFIHLLNTHSTPFTCMHFLPMHTYSPSCIHLMPHSYILYHMHNHKPHASYPYPISHTYTNSYRSMCLQVSTWECIYRKLQEIHKLLYKCPWARLWW